MNARGFTLLEVLVASAIVAVAVGAALEALSSGLDGARRAAAATERALLARSMIDSVGAEGALEAGATEGALEGGGAWRVSVARIDDGAGPGLWRIDVALEGGGAPPVSLSTLRIGP